ncbi:CRIB domain-containing protein RIC1-like [Salvia hispanica]|uniref:CRIB domain-containing protein RIC1-like n=1 Tax=Salvia hispanica TaxID=49212 RepID=UPI00200935A8|nr:CRIB domain-containing protein RIC1-like [Salvia hispanica]
MSTKMKGLFKGLRYISQIFDDEHEKEQDMQIGLPTDVKHVSHVGYDESNSKDNADVSEDSKRSQKGKKSQGKEQGTKPSRRRSTENNPLDAIKKTRRKKSEANEHKRSKNKSAGGDAAETQLGED